MLRFVVLAFVFIFSSCINVSAEQLIRVRAASVQVQRGPS